MEINWNTLPGPEDITRAELPNGIVILTRSNFESPSVVIHGYLASGSIFEPADRLGLANYTAQCLMRGTQTRSFQEIFEALESAGASLGFGASVHNANFGGRALAEDLSLLLNTLADCLRRPTFPAEHVEKLRARMLTSLSIRAQDTGEMASLTFDELLFPNHAYGRPEDGFVETIQAISRQDLEDFHRLHYGPRGLVIVIVGAVHAQDAIDGVQKTLGDWSNPGQPPAPDAGIVHPLTGTIRRDLSIPGKSQTDLVMGSLGPRRSSPDYFAASLGNNVLGQFGMMGRIGDVVREQAGLAYHASTSLNAWSAAGSWEVSAGVNPVNLERAIDLILSELKRFTSEPVSQDELSDSQANYIGRLPLSMESNSGVAGALVNIERFQLGLDYYRRYPALVSQVTTQQVLEAAHRYIDPQKLVIVSAGS